jgi:hypothetical protein
MDKDTFEQHRQKWKDEWFDHWRLLDIDFEMYMLMSGMTHEEFEYLNELNDENMERHI